MPTTRRTMAETLSAAQDAFLRVPENSVARDDEVPQKNDRPPERTQAQSFSTARATRPRLTRGGTAPLVSKTRRRESLRSVTLRLRTSVADALRRAAIERSLEYTEPFSQQAIVEAAVRNWLLREGYLSEEDC